MCFWRVNSSSSIYSTRCLTQDNVEIIANEFKGITRDYESSNIPWIMWARHFVNIYHFMMVTVKLPKGRLQFKFHDPLYKQFSRRQQCHFQKILIWCTGTGISHALRYFNFACRCCLNFVTNEWEVVYNWKFKVNTFAVQFGSQPVLIFGY